MAEAIRASRLLYDGPPENRAAKDEARLVDHFDPRKGLKAVSRSGCVAFAAGSSDFAAARNRASTLTAPVDWAKWSAR